MPVTILIILNQRRYRNAYKLISTINRDLKTLGVGCKLQFSKLQEGNKVVLTVDNTLTKCIISTKLMRILGFECDNLQVRKQDSLDLKKISYKKLTTIASFIDRSKLLGDSVLIKKN